MPAPKTSRSRRATTASSRPRRSSRRGRGGRAGGGVPARSARARAVRERRRDSRVVTTPEGFVAVRRALDEAGLPYENAEITMEPQNSIDLDAGTARQTLRLIDALEENDDVQDVYANFDISDEVMSVVVGEEVNRGGPPFGRPRGPPGEEPAPPGTSTPTSTSATRSCRLWWAKRSTGRSCPSALPGCPGFLA